MKKIDIHCHTTNRQVHNVIPTSCTIDSITSEMSKYKIEKTVVLATYFPHRASGISNFRLLRWIENRSEFLMFASLDFEHYFNQGINEISELTEKKEIQGIKIYTSYQKIDLYSKEMKSVMDIAKDNSLPVMFHTGQSYSSMRNYGTYAITEIAKPQDLEFLAKNYPNVNIIMSHLAKPYFDNLITVVKRNENIYSDMSGLIDSKHDRKDIPLVIDEIKRFVGECGSKRLLFGTDFPVQTHDDSIYFIEIGMSDFSDSERLDVYYDNAKKLLNLRGQENDSQQ